MFTKVANRRATGAELGTALGLHPRAVSDFFDALVAMRFLEREGDGPSAKYFNTPASALYLASGQSRYVGGILVMLNAVSSSFGTTYPRPRALEGHRMRSSMARRECLRSFMKSCQGSNDSSAR